ncbi:MAG: DUF4215 domain-containing protein [Candidatus Binatia bacterium]
MKFFCASILSAAMVASLSTPSAAQPQDKAQQACLNKVVKSAGKISGAVLKDASNCIKKGATGKLPMGVTADSCLTADLKGKVQKSENKVASTATKSCTTAPDFGFSDAATAAEAYVVDNHALSDDAFGADLDVTLAASDPVDPSGRCSSTLPGTWRKLASAMHREVEGCLKNGLKAGTILDVATFEACLDNIHTDSKGKVGKATGLVQSKLTSTCPAGDLAGIFPGLAPICSVYGTATDAAGLAACSRDRLECRVCRIFNAAYGLDRDCDAFDNPGALGSCPDCGNTAIDSGESCDDGNEVSGDGCTALCIDEFCGDGTINDNGAEACDDGNGNSDVTPDACRLDCTEPVCGDGVTDTGEECDDANMDENDGCTSQCTSCGNGVAGGLEQCDDGNNDAGDCCSPSCTFEAMGSPCLDAADGDCTDPGCDGAGACEEQAADNGTPCDDDEECSNASACNGGSCVGTSYVVTGLACNWAVVGNPWPGAGTDTRRVDLTQGASSTGPWCGAAARIGDTTTMTGDLVVTGNSTAVGAEIDNLANIDALDVVADNVSVIGLAGDSLPGLPFPTTSVAAGQVVAKTPSGEYDTTGLDQRVDQCEAAQLSISTSTATQLDALSADADLGATGTGLASSSTFTINPVNPGVVNVIDLDNLTGNTGVTLNISGGNDPGTVMILRIDGSFDTNVGWIWNLTDGLTPERLLIYGKGGGTGNCEIGQNNTGGGGTIFCPNGRIRIVSGSTWTGALFGGGASTIAVDVGQNVVLTHQRFLGF